MKKQKNYLVYFQGEDGKHQERQLHSYQIAQALKEATNGHILIIIS
jgi:hypothetical protein